MAFSGGSKANCAPALLQLGLGDVEARPRAGLPRLQIIDLPLRRVQEGFGLMCSAFHSYAYSRDQIDPAIDGAGRARGAAFGALADGWRNGRDALRRVMLAGGFAFRR